MIPYVCPPKSERPLDFRQPYGKTNVAYVENIDLAHAMGGIADPIRQSVQLGRHQMRIAHMFVPLTGHTPEVMGGWEDVFHPFGAKVIQPNPIATTQVGAGIHGQLPWLEKTNIRKPRSMTFSRIMDVLTGNN